MRKNASFLYIICIHVSLIYLFVNNIFSLRTDIHKNCMKTRFKMRFTIFLYISRLCACTLYYRCIRRTKLKQIIFAPANKPDRHYLVGFNSSPLAFHFALALIISTQDRWSCTRDSVLYIYILNPYTPA